MIIKSTNIGKNRIIASTLKKGNCYNIIGVAGEGQIYSAPNPISMAYELIYELPIGYIGSFENDYIYLVQQFNHKKNFIDPKWNMGEPLVTDEKIDLKDEEIKYWGIQDSSGGIFYRVPDKEIDE